MNSLKQDIDELIALADMVQPEGEPLDLTDREYTIEHMSQLRSRLSQIRRDIDLINNALARAWDKDHRDKVTNDGANIWYVGRTKGKKVVDADMFFEWLATRTPDELRRLITPTNTKVSGMTPSERETHFDESEVNDRLSIKSKPSDMP